MATYQSCNNTGDTWINANQTTKHTPTIFWTDLRTILQQWTDQGDQIIMGINANEDIWHPDITTFYNKFRMTKIIINKHGQDAPPTQNHSSYLINGLFITRAILNSQCGYLNGLNAIGNHRCLWIDIPETHIFGTTMSAVQAPKARQLKTEDLWTVKKYLDYLENYIMSHDLINKTKMISDQLNDRNDLMEAITTQLNAIDTLQIQGMLRAKKQCHNLHTQLYGWMPLITHLIQTIKYWHYLAKQAQGKPYHVQILFRLQKALLECPNSTNMTQEENDSQLANNKAKLWC